MKKLTLNAERLADLSSDELRSVAGAATGTCSMQCRDTIEDCEQFTYGCTQLSEKLCVTGIG